MKRRILVTIMAIAACTATVSAAPETNRSTTPETNRFVNERFENDRMPEKGPENMPAMTDNHFIPEHDANFNPQNAGKNDITFDSNERPNTEMPDNEMPVPREMQPQANRIEMPDVQNAENKKGKMEAANEENKVFGEVIKIEDNKIEIKTENETKTYDLSNAKVYEIPKMDDKQMPGKKQNEQVNENKKDQKKENDNATDENNKPDEIQNQTQNDENNNVHKEPQEMPKDKPENKGEEKAISDIKENTRICLELSEDGNVESVVIAN